MPGILLGKKRNRLAVFLQSDDLDNTLNAYSQLGEINEDDHKEVYNILNQWNDAQAISNILMYPYLIKEEERIEALLKGIMSENYPYFSLAAAVGLQQLKAKNVSDGIKTNIICSLIEVAKKHPQISDIVIVTLEKYITKKDSEKICLLLCIDNETAKHNIIAWLLRKYKYNKKELCAMLEASALSQELKDMVIDKYNENKSKKENDEFTNLEFTLFGYIPNLKDMR